MFPLQFPPVVSSLLGTWGDSLCHPYSVKYSTVQYMLKCENA